MDAESVVHILGRLLGKPVWGVATGGMIVSSLFFSFGAMIPRETLMANEELDPRVRANDAEYSLFVRGVWRLVRDGRVITSSAEPTELDVHMAATMRALVGATVSAVAVTQPGNLTRRGFSDGGTLELFPLTTEVSGLYDFS